MAIQCQTAAGYVLLRSYPLPRLIEAGLQPLLVLFGIEIDEGLGSIGQLPRYPGVTFDPAAYFTLAPCQGAAKVSGQPTLKQHDNGMQTLAVVSHGDVMPPHGARHLRHQVCGQQWSITRHHHHPRRRRGTQAAVNTHQRPVVPRLAIAYDTPAKPPIVIKMTVGTDQHLGHLPSQTLMYETDQRPTGKRDQALVLPAHAPSLPTGKYEAGHLLERIDTTGTHWFFHAP